MVHHRLLKELFIALSLFTLVAILLPLFGASPSPTPTRIPTPKPTPTPYPPNTILSTRSQLLRHFEHRFSLDTWTEEIYPDGTIRVTGQSIDGRLRLYIWTTTAQPDNVSELWFSFRYNEQVFSRSRERENGTRVILDTLRLTFPQWLEGETWLRENITQEQSSLVIDGVPLYLQHGREALTGDHIVVMDIMEK